MSTNPTPWTRQKLISVLTGYSRKTDEIRHENRVSGQCYCYRVGSDDRIWVHRATPEDKWFGINKATRDRLVDWPTTNSWSSTYYKDGYELKHILVMESNDSFTRKMRGATTSSDISNLTWYAFPDSKIKSVSTDERGKSDQFYIKLEGSLKEELQSYYQDAGSYLPKN